LGIYDDSTAFDPALFIVYIIKMLFRKSQVVRRISKKKIK